MMALRRWRPKICKALIAHPAVDLCTQDLRKEGPLYRAVQLGSVELVTMMLGEFLCCFSVSTAPFMKLLRLMNSKLHLLASFTPLGSDFCQSLTCTRRGRPNALVLWEMALFFAFFQLWFLHQMISSFQKLSTHKKGVFFEVHPFFENFREEQTFVRFSFLEIKFIDTMCS